VNPVGRSSILNNDKRGQRKGGDQGQRYEVRFKANARNPEIVFGWSDSPEGAQAMADRINRHPAWRSPRVIDRLGPGGEQVSPKAVDRPDEVVALIQQEVKPACGSA
jgi:hypothetical protein